MTWLTPKWKKLDDPNKRAKYANRIWGKTVHPVHFFGTVVGLRNETTIVPKELIRSDLNNTYDDFVQFVCMCLEQGYQTAKFYYWEDEKLANNGHTAFDGGLATINVNCPTIRVDVSYYDINDEWVGLVHGGKRSIVITIDPKS